MARVEIYKLNNDGSQRVIATCKLVEDKVICEGDEKFVEHLSTSGIYDYSQTPLAKILPENGRVFLEQLKFNFKSGYLNASEVKED